MPEPSFARVATRHLPTSFEARKRAVEQARRASTPRTAGMSAGQFWAAVADIGWGTRTTDYKAIQKKLMKRWDVTEATAFRDTFDRFQGQLMNRLNQWERETGNDLGVGGDSFSDLTAHIIGLGKREFDAVMKDPQLAYDRAVARYGTRDGYVESFSYAIPHERDYREKAKGLSKFTDWAAKVIKEYEHSSRHPAFRPVKAELDALIAGLGVLTTGDVRGFLAQAPALKAKSEAVEEYYKGIGAAASKDGYSSATTNKWAVWNLLSGLTDSLE